MASSTRRVFIVAAKRTPFGTFGGKLRGLTATELGKVAAVAALKAGNVPPEKVDSVIIGNVAQNSQDAIYIARHIGLMAGVPVPVPALTVNRLCGSGFQSIVNGAHEIKLGEADIVLTGGAENMSQSPYAVRDIRWGTVLGKELKLEDTLWCALTDSYCKLPMALTAEKLAEQYGISREDCDKYALLSQERWAKAHSEGVFEAELAPVEVKTRKGPAPFTCDEHPRDTSLEKLAQLSPVFKKDGCVTAGNASGICDGAGAVVLASEEAVQRHGLSPLARLVDYSVVGVDPAVMGIGPAHAIPRLLERNKLALRDIGLVEVNEAFAAQCLSVVKEAGLDQDTTNAHGGAIALGHPLAASGARITAHLAHQIQMGRVGGSRFAVGSACIGGGQGIAVLLERV